MASQVATHRASSTRALRLAWAAAQERTGHDPSGASIDSWDLLVGVVLAGPGESEAAQAFRAFGVVAGQALASDYPQLTADGLQRRLTVLPPDLEPPIAPDTEALVSTAREIDGTADVATGVASWAFWVALLTWTGGAADQVHALLRQRGVDAAQLAAATRDWMARGGEEPYQKVLADFTTTPSISSTTRPINPAAVPQRGSNRATTSSGSPPRSMRSPT